MSTLYLVRHGRPELPDEKPRFLGQTDLPLSARGRAEAEALAPALRGIPLARAVHSGMARARETLDILLAGRDALPVRKVPELREIHCGDWEMRTLEEVAAMDPEGFEARGRDFARYRPPGGESFMDVRDRVWPAFQSILREEGDTIVVAHAGVIRAIVVTVLGLSWDRLFSITQDYCGVHVLERYGDHLVVKRLNWLPDLPQK